MRTVAEVVEDRVSGLAAEMAFFALLSLVPLGVAIGALVGYVTRQVGPETVDRVETSLISALGVVFSRELLDDVLAPFVRGVLTAGRGGVAVGGFVLALYLASRVFTATIRALDLAYDVPESRGALRQRIIAIGLAAGFVVVVGLTLTLMVVGPLLGSGRMLAARLGLGDVFAVLWSVGRWPLLLAVMVGFLAAVYRYGPNVDHGWRESLPGAALGVVLWMLATLGFRVYLAAGGGSTDALASEDAAVQLVGRVLGALVATILWTYLSGFAILVGGEFNAVLRRDRS